MSLALASLKKAVYTPSWKFLVGIKLSNLGDVIGLGIPNEDRLHTQLKIFSRYKSE